jgi:hypothetical protein
MHCLLCRRYGLLGLPFDHDVAAKGKIAPRKASRRPPSKIGQSSKASPFKLGANQSQEIRAT